MKDTSKIFIEIYSGMNPVSKYAIKYGTVVITTLLFCALYFYILSNTSSYPYYYTLFYTDILLCIKECMGSVYILPMLYETISLAAKSGRY